MGEDFSLLHRQFLGKPMSFIPTISRAVARSIIPTLFKEGYSATRALAILKIEGLSYRRQTFLADWREVTGVAKLKRLTRFIPKTKHPTVGIMTPKASPVGGKYTYNFEFDVRDPITGEWTKRSYGYSSDDFLTVQEAENRTRANIIEGESDTSLEKGSAVLTSVLKR